MDEIKIAIDFLIFPCILSVVTGFKVSDLCRSIIKFLFESKKNFFDGPRLLASHASGETEGARCRFIRKELTHGIE